VEFREANLGNSKSPEDALFSLVDDKTRLITISSVQYSTGLRMNLDIIGEFCKSRGIIFCVDAIQSLGAMRFDVQKIHADFVMADGHKWMLGPEGLAVFYSSPDARDLLDLNQYGWHMIEDAGNFDIKNWSTAKTARRFECGSPNMLGIYALNASLSLLLESGMDYVEKEVLKRSEYLFNIINKEPALELITPNSQGRYAGITTFRRSGVEPEPLYQYLMQNNVVCAARSGGIRLSPHFYTPYEQLDHAIELVMSYSA
jgi:selenocysteine lyase/cysteine desulfurase